jgi:hypothetical protein
MASTSNYIVERESQKLAVGCHMHLCHGSPVWADTVEKLQFFRPGKTIYVLSFLSNLTHGGDHINRDLFLQSHC